MTKSAKRSLFFAGEIPLALALREYHGTAAEIVALLGKKCKLEVRAAVENWSQGGQIEFHGLSYIPSEPATTADCSARSGVGNSPRRSSPVCSQRRTSCEMRPPTKTGKGVIK